MKLIPLAKLAYDRALISSERPHFGKWLIVAATLLLAVAVRIACWAADTNFWLDEAMLYQAIKDQTAFAPWVPLGQYTQAAPLLPALLWKSLIVLFGTNEMILRLPSLLAGVAGLYVLWLVTRRRLRPIGSAATILIAGFSQTAVEQANEFKQYSFEFLAAALILYLASRVAEAPDNRGAMRWLFIMSIVSLTFTYTAPIVVAACLFGLLASFVVAGSHQDRLGRLVLWGAPWAVAVLAWQHWVIAPSTHLQFEGNRRYASEYLQLSDPGTWHHVGRILTPLYVAIPPGLAKIALVLMCAIWVIGAAVGLRRRMFEHAICVGAIACLIMLSALKFFPFAAPRKLLFLLPLFALSFGAALDDALYRLRPAIEWRYVALSFLAAVILVPLTIRASANPHNEPVRELIAAIPADACPSVWSYYMAWPAIETYKERRPDIEFLGQIPTASGIPSWSWKVHDIFPAYVADLVDLASRKRLCLLFSHTASHEKRKREKTVLLEAMNQHSCAPIVVKSDDTELYRCN